MQDNDHPEKFLVMMEPKSKKFQGGESSIPEHDAERDDYVSESCCLGRKCATSDVFNESHISDRRAE